MKIKDAFQINPGGSIRQFDRFINYIDTSSVIAGRLTDVQYLTSDYPSRAKRVLKIDDILYSSVRPNLKHYYHYNFAIEHPVASTGFVVLRNKRRENIDTRFCFYFLTQSHIVDYLDNIAQTSQTTFPTFSYKDLGRIFLPSISIDKQRKITSILSAYDDLIENNNKRIKILEQMAANLYKEWFVRFRFPGYENAEFENGIPKGWERVKLSDLIEFNPSVKKSNHAQYKIIPMSALSNSSLLIDDSLFEKSNRLEGSRSCNGDTLLARITPCLENGKTGFVHGLNNGEVAGGSTEFIVMRAKAISSFLVYFIARDPLFRRFAIASMNGADGRQRVKVEKLKKIQWIKPAGKINAMFDEKCGLMFELIYKLNSENQNLIKQRNMLLPRLMSGKLEV